MCLLLASSLKYSMASVAVTIGGRSNWRLPIFDGGWRKSARARSRKSRDGDYKPITAVKNRRVRMHHMRHACVRAPVRIGQRLRTDCVLSVWWPGRAAILLSNRSNLW